MVEVDLVDWDFTSLTSEELQNLLKNRDSSNINQCLDAAKRVMYQYWLEKEIDFDEISRKPESYL